MAAHFARDLHSVGRARRFATDHLGAAPPDLHDHAVLVVSELASNAIRHAQSSFDLRIEACPDAVRVEVVDQSTDLPQPRQPAPGDPSGRGLMIIDTVSEQWGYERQPEGKTVWAVLRPR